MPRTSRLAIGDTVRSLPTVRPKRAANKVGTVVAVNRRAAEIGVAWAAHPDPKGGADTWFLPGELVLVEVAQTAQDHPGGAESSRVARRRAVPAKVATGVPS